MTPHAGHRAPIAVVDYGVGNLQSVRRAFEAVGALCRIIDSPAEAVKAERLVLPGVGSFATAMARLEESGFREVLEERVIGDGVPLLGICLGFQLMTRRSDEGNAPGLGWLDAETRRFPRPGSDPGYRVPHLGWSALELRRDSPLVAGLGPESCCYFAHSYFVSAGPGEGVVATARHGVEFAAVMQRRNLVGMQFHPEKSHANGLTLIRNFVGWEWASHA